jgi:hypothetical protein
LSGIAGQTPPSEVGLQHISLTPDDDPVVHAFANQLLADGVIAKLTDKCEGIRPAHWEKQHYMITNGSEAFVTEYLLQRSPVSRRPGSGVRKQHSGELPSSLAVKMSTRCTHILFSQDIEAWVATGAYHSPEEEGVVDSCNSETFDAVVVGLPSMDVLDLFCGNNVNVSTGRIQRDGAVAAEENNGLGKFLKQLESVRYSRRSFSSLHSKEFIPANVNCTLQICFERCVSFRSMGRLPAAELVLSLCVRRPYSAVYFHPKHKARCRGYRPRL